MSGVSPEDFKPRNLIVGLGLFAVCFVVGLGLITALLYWELSPERIGTRPAAAQRAALLCLYAVAAYIALLYLVLGAHRFRFYSASFQVFSWRGWRTFSWAEVQGASISTYKANAELALVLGPRRRVSIPLTSFRRSEDLLAFLRSRISVPVVATPEQLKLLAER